MIVCNMGASLYEPINVYKPVAADIGIVDGPFEYLTVGGVTMPLPFTTRMTVVRLSNGDLFLHSPIKFDGRLANELLGLGAVRHLVSPNQFHYAHIGEWAKAFPNAVTWASPRVRNRARARHVDVNFTRDLDASPAEEWRQEIDQMLFPGGYFKEFIFFHKTSKTLILTDTIINIELDKVTEPWRTATKLTGMYYPFGQIFFGMRLPLRLQRQKAEAAISKIRSSQRQVTRGFCESRSCVSRRPGRKRVRRRSQCNDRIPLGGGSLRPLPSVRQRTGGAPSGCNRYHQPRRCIGCRSGDLRDPNRFLDW